MNPILDRIAARVADDGAKVALLNVLAREPRRSFSTTALGQYLPLPQSEIDGILRCLVDDGFVDCSRAQGEPLYRLTTHPEVRQAVLHLARRGHGMRTKTPPLARPSLSNTRHSRAASLLQGLAGHIAPASHERRQSP